MPETIEMLCEKLGVVVEELIPEVVRMNVWSAIIWLAVGVVMLLTLVVYHFCICPKIRKSETLDAYDKPFIIGLVYSLVGVAAFIGLVVVACNASDLLRWIVAPRARAIQYVVSWVG